MKHGLLRLAPSLAPLAIFITVTSGISMPAFGASSASPSDSFRVMTYNIKMGAALRAERRVPARLKHVFSIAARLQSDDRLKNPDILAVQEICAFEDGGYQIDYFQKAVAGGASHFYFGLSDPASPPEGCGRSAAVFSRWPIRDGGLIQLPDVKEPRSAVWVDIEVPVEGHDSRWLRVYSAHMENRPQGDNWEGRYLQARTLTTHIEAFQRDFPDRPIILMGDLNTVGMVPAPWVREPALFEIRRVLEPALWDKFHQTLVPVPYQLDWIFHRGLTLGEARVARILLSDHFPVVAEFSWSH